MICAMLRAFLMDEVIQLLFDIYTMTSSRMTLIFQFNPDLSTPLTHTKDSIVLCKRDSTRFIIIIRISATITASCTALGTSLFRSKKSLSLRSSISTTYSIIAIIRTQYYRTSKTYVHQTTARCNSISTTTQNYQRRNLPKKYYFFK